MLIRYIKKIALTGEGFSYDYGQLLEQIDYYAVTFIKNPGKKVRFTISPDNIVLNSDIIKNVSTQNQIKGKVKKIINKKNSYFITMDCGIDLVAKVTKAAINKMNIKVGNIIYCMIKANAVEVVHIYDNRKNMN